MLALAQDGSFSFKNLGKDPNFESNITLFGDAKVVPSESRVQLTNSVESSAGRVVYKKPIKLVEGKSGRFASISTYFSFSMSAENGGGDGLVFFMAPRSSNFRVFGGKGESNVSIVAVEFDALKNHVGIDVGSLEKSVKVRNLAPFHLVLNHGKKLHTWIDFEASSKRLEIRLNHSGDIKPVAPLLSYNLDLFKMWGDEEIFVGLSSSNGNSSQSCSIYSWSFKSRHLPNWMHSQPLDPKALITKNPKIPTDDGEKSDCLLKVLGALVSGVVFGALATFGGMYLWRMFGKRRPVVPEECAMHPVDFEYKKFQVVVEKGVEDEAK